MTDFDDGMMAALAKDAAMLESMGAGEQPLAFGFDRFWMELDDALIGNWKVVDDSGKVYGDTLTMLQAQQLIDRLEAEATS